MHGLALKQLPKGLSLNILLFCATLSIVTEALRGAFLFESQHRQNNSILTKAPVFWVSPSASVTRALALRTREFWFMGNRVERLFENDQLCFKCGYWYTPERFIDDDFICTACLRKMTRNIKYRSAIRQQALTILYQKMRSDTIDTLEENSVIYFIQGKRTKLIKIGFSSNFWSRFESLRIGSPDILELLGVINAPYYFEQELHNFFELYHSHGEWYEPVSWLKKWIKTNGYIPKKDNK